MKTIQEISREHSAKIEALRQRKAPTSEIIDQLKANSIELCAEIEAWKAETFKLNQNNPAFHTELGSQLLNPICPNCPHRSHPGVSCFESDCCGCGQ